MKRTILVCLLVMTALSVILSAEKYYWQYWPFEPAVVYGTRILNPDSKVTPGGILNYEVDIDRKTDIVPVVKRELRNTFVYLYVPSSPPSRPVMRQKINVPIPIPRAAEYGKYYLYITISYPYPNDRVVNIEAKAGPFWVVPKEKK